MDDVGEMQRQLQQLREAGRIRDDVLRYLRMRQDLQRERWDKLNGVNEDAAKQYTMMRQDVAEEGQKDQGSPLWLEVALTVTVDLIPLGALTGRFLNAMTKSTQKLLTRADRKALQTYESYLKRYSSQFITNEKQRLVNEIELVGDMVAQFAKDLERVRDPILVTPLKVVANELKGTVGKHLFMQDSGHGSERKMVQHPNAPIVVVSQSLRKWIETQIRAERIARHRIEAEVEDLFDIATSPTPSKEAKAKDAEAIKEASSGSKGNGLIGPPKPFPNTNKTALDQLTELRNGLALDPAEDPGDMQDIDLQELMKGIESIIWATTYDFTPRPTEVLGPVDPSSAGYQFSTTLEERTAIIPAPLPKALWKRLIERYRDPRDAEGKTFEQAGHSSNLAGVAGPPDPRPGMQKLYSPEVRLSYYFSQVLYPQINEKNNKMVTRFSAL